jgi:hypothetical protein
MPPMCQANRGGAMNNDIRRGKGFGFESQGQVYMVRCFECGRENHVSLVAAGICVWCGHDGNKKP